MNWPKTEI